MADPIIVPPPFTIREIERIVVGPRPVAFMEVEDDLGSAQMSIRDALSPHEWSVKWYGALGNNVQDDTTYIQATLDAAKAAFIATGNHQVVYLPPGRYKVTDTITSTTDGVSFYGAGMMVSIINPVGDFGNVLEFVGGYAGGVNLRDFSIRKTDVATNGCLLLTQQLAYSVVSHISLEGGFGGLRLQGPYMMQYDNITITGGDNLAGSGTVAGSYFLAVPTNGNPANPTFDTLLSNLLLRNTATATKAIESGILINQCDGLWFDNAHVIGAKFEVTINVPITYSVQNVQWNNVFLDGGCVQHVQIIGAGTVAGMRFGDCVFGGADGTGVADSVVVNCPLLRGLSFRNCEWGSNQASALNLIAGTYMDVVGCKFCDNNMGSVANVLNIEAGSSRVNVMGNSFGYQPTGAAIFLTGPTYTTITGNDFKQCGATDVLLNGALGTTCFILNNTSDRSATIASAAALPIPNVGSFFSITGITAITSLPVGPPQRIITLQFAASVTVTNGANLKLAGGVNFSATADDCLTLVCGNGTIWSEVSRSVN